MAFRARKVSGAFEKRAPEVFHLARPNAVSASILGLNSHEMGILEYRGTSFRHLFFKGCIKVSFVDA